MAMLFVEASAELIAMGGGSSALNGVNGATLLAWINPVTLAAGDHSVVGLSTGTAAGSSRAKLGVNGNGSIRGNGRCLDADANQSFNGTLGIVTTGSWQHIATSLDYVNKIIKVYYNGALDATSGVVAWGAAPSSATNSLSYNIASQHGGGSEFVDGSIDDVRVYNRVLSDAEIASLYAVRGMDSIKDGLQGAFLLNEGAPTVGAAGAGIIKDNSINMMNGTPGGTANPTWTGSQVRARRRLSS